ncbi:MAG TPA: hypothetical protein DDW76_35415 [Cyanobacteria bacterium UBA11369]|nr:hypothetical protein [Cyanobacteria bacterium UBA11371]HBE34808.1 hypothetical protein [Cyanobacteria bacterium UBA11368]HBE53899.1 hypothetical protein [Cyanobacteria bacterium UBA11369]
MPRSLKIHPQYIPAVKSSLLRNGFLSQKILAEDLGIAQSTVSNFLNGKPVDYANFLEICQALGQEWRNIADLSDLSSDRELALSWTNVTSETVEELPMPNAPPELPEGQVELASRFYIERPPIEARCYETIVQPGALIRIKAPRQMGKTSLMSRILHCAETQGSRAIAVNFQLASKRIFNNLDTFLQWFCAGVGLALGQLEPLSNCWQLADIIGSNLCCKAYFEQYLLSENLPPLTLALDEVDRIFEFPEIADDFLGLLRALHEESKRSEKWKKFRLILVHSTEVYIPLDMNKSPFNVGLPIELPEFNPQQVQQLARRHGIDCHENQVEQLMDLVGGHPFLVRLAMYHIARGDITLDRLVQESATEAGIYSDHLRRHLWNLDKYPEIKLAFAQVVTAAKSVRLPSEQGFKLNSMGLVKLDGSDCIPRCKLYRKYFSDRLSTVDS